VFYVATMRFACGISLAATCKYLEAAIANGTTPSTWKPGTTAQWGCNRIDVMTSLQRTASLEIGQGRANTRLITGASCSTSTTAASIATAYNGGGINDWFLPSSYELNELCKYVRNIGQAAGVTVPCLDSVEKPLFVKDNYWSSSEVSQDTAWVQYFNFGDQGSSYKSSTLLYVRPVRAF
jgi:Protein of unknown function (DUF1566)